MIFNVSKIVKDNYTLLYKDAHKSHVYCWLFCIPLIISCISVIFNFSFTEAQLGHIISFVSIIVGFLINVSVILISTQNSKGIVGDLVKRRGHANIFYSILVGILIVFAIIIGPSLLDIVIPHIPFIPYVATVILFSIFLHFMIMILIVIKAFYALYR